MQCSVQRGIQWIEVSIDFDVEQVSTFVRWLPRDFDGPRGAASNVKGLQRGSVSLYNRYSRSHHSCTPFHFLSSIECYKPLDSILHCEDNNRIHYFEITFAA